MAMSAPTSMFTHTTQIPRSPLASTLTLAFHVCLGLAVVLVTAIPSIPREHKSESLTYMTVAPLPDLRIDIPKTPRDRATKGDPDSEARSDRRCIRRCHHACAEAGARP